MQIYINLIKIETETKINLLINYGFILKLIKLCCKRQKVLLIRISFLCRIYFVISKNRKIFIPFPDLLWTQFQFFHSRFIGHPSNYVYDEHQSTLLFSYTILYYTISLVDSRIYVSQDGGRSILSLEFSIPSFSPSIPTIFLRFLEWVGTKKGTKMERFCFRNPRFIDIWGNQFEEDKWITKYGPRFRSNRFASNVSGYCAFYLRSLETRIVSIMILIRSNCAWLKENIVLFHVCKQIL